MSVETEPVVVAKQQESTQKYSPLGKKKLSFVKFVLLSLITLGIYGIYVYAKMGDTLNMAASATDGKKTMNYWLLALLISPITCGIGGIVWQHKFSGRLGREAERRGLPCKINSATFWLWGVLGCVIVVGPFVYTYKLIQAVNLLAENMVNE